MDDYRVQGPGADGAGPSTHKRARTSRFRIKRLGKLGKLAVVLLVVLLAAGGYFYQTNRISNLKKEIAGLSNPQEAARAETDRIKEAVGKLIELPANESPTIATVVDAEKLRSQAFFANAQNGDRVLMFPQAKKAVLYRPSTNKVIEVAPINIGAGTTSQTTTTTPTTTTKKP